MKKILLFLLVFISVRTFAQYPNGIQTLGSDSNLVQPKGGFKARVINWTFTDTTQANTQHIKEYPGAQIFTTSDNKFWLRNATTTAWISVGSGGSADRFGIEDNTGVQDRAIDMQNHSWDYQNLSQINMNFPSALSLTNYYQDPYLFQIQTFSNSQKGGDLQIDSNRVFVRSLNSSSATGNALSIYNDSIKIDKSILGVTSSYHLPLTVNSIAADATNNITIPIGGSGGIDSLHVSNDSVFSCKTGTCTFIFRTDSTIIYTDYTIDSDTTSNPGYQTIFLNQLVLDSLLHKKIDTGAYIPNNYVLGYDSTNKKFVFVNLPTYPPTPTPTLDDVLTAGNVSTQNATVGTLNVTAPSAGSSTDSVVVIDLATGEIKYRNAASFASGITALTGDVTASGTGSVAATLSTTGVLGGPYNWASIQVDAKGRLLKAAQNSIANVGSGQNLMYRVDGVDGSSTPITTLNFKKLHDTTGISWHSLPDSSLYALVSAIDTTSLSNRINLKLNISDSSGMLTNYRNAINTNAANILLKLNITDTASKWMTNVRRIPGSTTVEKQVGGTWTTAFTDSVGSGGGGSSITRQVITSGASGTVTGGNYIVTIDPASTLASYTLTMPASPTDLQTVEIQFGGTLTSGIIVTALTISANSGQTILDNTPPGSATADNSLFYTYRTSNTKWYRRKL